MSRNAMSLAARQPAASASPLIACQDLRKEYRMGENVVVALKGVTTEISEGEFLAIMGPSGSGKSTFMNLLGALDTPTSGKLQIAGREVSTLSGDALAALRNEEIGFVFQQFMLLARTDAVDNVKLPLMYTHLSAKDKDRRAKAALDRVGLGDRLDHTPAQLSGGQQQRVAIARALVNNPRMILADEPTGALDTATSEQIMELFQDLNDEGVTVVLVTHEEEIAAYARRIMRFRDGELQIDEMRDGRRRGGRP